MALRKLYISVFCIAAALTASPSMPTSDLPSVDVFVGGSNGYPVYRIPAMVVTNQGTILAFCEGRKTGIFDHGNIDLVLKRSFDHGKTWGPLQVIRSEGFKTWGNPAPVVDRDTGRIWLPFCLDNSRVFVTWSDDDGASWSEPREITDDVKRPGWGWYATGPGHSIRLSSGRLLVPCDHGTTNGMFSHVIYSDDHGETWKLGGALEKGTDESMAVEADGRVYLTMRNNRPEKRRAYSWSGNGGLDWSPVKLEEKLIGPTCQASILRMTSLEKHGKNRILFLNPASEDRENMAVRISYDEAGTWSETRTVYSGPAAYSDMTLLPDLSVGALYERGNIWPYRKIVFTRMELKWITRGKDRISKQ